MKNTRATYRYAKSLLELAKEQGALEDCKSDMQHIVDTCLSSKELVLLLKSPVVKTDKKQTILANIFSNCSKLTMQFIQLITAKKRELLLLDIAQRFLLAYKQDKGIETATLTTAKSIDEDTRNKILGFIKSQGIKQVDLSEKVDPSIIGGAILRVGDKQLDVSVTKQINDLKQTFNKNLYLKDF
ncbi:MAG: ATP synthase F1 subunit delta [Flavobacteriales bacterium]